MSINKKNEKSIDELNNKLESVKDKLDNVTNLIEEEIIDTPKSKTNVRVVEMPSDIEIDESDIYNTSPTNYLFHNYNKNHKMFRNNAFRIVFRSKIFWIMLFALPLIITFIQYWAFALLYKFGIIHNGGIKHSLLVLLNNFYINPLLILSLIIFPTIIVIGREDNTLKRYALLSMSRKQMYFSYMRFVVLFLFVYIFLFIGPWFWFLNLAMDRIFLTSEQIKNGEHVFNNPWRIFFGFEYHSNIQWTSYFNTRKISWCYNKQLITNAMEQGITDFSDLPFVTPMDIYNLYMEYIAPQAIDLMDATYEEQLDFVKELNVIVTELTSYSFNGSYKGIPYEYMSETEMQQFIETIAYPLYSPEEYRCVIWFSNEVPNVTFKQYEGAQSLLLILIFVPLSIISINSIGYSKAMKVNSPHQILTWGIMILIFSKFVYISLNLIYKDVWALENINNFAWYLLIFILLFSIKWMFLLSPITIIIFSFPIIMGFTTEPIYYQEPVWYGELERLLNYYSAEIFEYSPTAYYFLRNIYNELRFMSFFSTTESPIDPSIRTTFYISLSMICSIYWIVYIWFKKTKVFSYSVTR